MLENKTVIQRRNSFSGFTSGKATKTSFTDSTRSVSFQPITGDEILTLPEADRKTAKYKIYDTQEWENDDLCIDGSISYIVKCVEPWDWFGLTHWKCILVSENV